MVSADPDAGLTLKVPTTTTHTTPAVMGPAWPAVRLLGPGSREEALRYKRKVGTFMETATLVHKDVMTVEALMFLLQ